MTRLDALKELAAEVEGGTTLNYAFEFVAISLDHTNFALKAYNGSLDSAKALHESVLLHHGVTIDMIERCVGMHVECMDDDDRYCDEWVWLFEVKFTDNPARAWLLAIIKALIAQGITR